MHTSSIWVLKFRKKHDGQMSSVQKRHMYHNAVVTHTQNQHLPPVHYHFMHVKEKKTFASTLVNLDRQYSIHNWLQCVLHPTNGHEFCMSHPKLHTFSTGERSSLTCICVSLTVAYFSWGSGLKASFYWRWINQLIRSTQLKLMQSNTTAVQWILLAVKIYSF